jgi:hypothetical protein
MALSLSDINQIAREVVASVDARLAVVGITPAEGSTAYSEIVVQVSDCQQPPCLIAIGVRRNVSETDLRSEIAEAVRRQAVSHDR